MLESENAIPERLAYDRPSPKLIGFLKKHYELVDYVPQNNNYVVFNRYFSTTVLPICKINDRKNHSKDRREKNK